MGAGAIGCAWTASGRLGLTAAGATRSYNISVQAIPIVGGRVVKLQSEGKINEFMVLDKDL